MTKRYESEAEMLADIMGRETTRVESVPGGGEVALYHVVLAHEPFENAAMVIFHLICHAQEQWPGKPRHLFLDIDGHRNAAGGFDSDMDELQTHFVTEMMSQWLTAVTMPLAAFTKPDQSDDVPPALKINAAP